jgi:hypothetical protein
MCVVFSSVKCCNSPCRLLVQADLGRDKTTRVEGGGPTFSAAALTAKVSTLAHAKKSANLDHSAGIFLFGFVPFVILTLPKVGRGCYHFPQNRPAISSTPGGI